MKIYCVFYCPYFHERDNIIENVCITEDLNLALENYLITKEDPALSVYIEIWENGDKLATFNGYTIPENKYLIDEIEECLKNSK